MKSILLTVLAITSLTLSNCTCEYAPGRAKPLSQNSEAGFLRDMYYVEDTELKQSQYFKTGAGDAYIAPLLFKKQQTSPVNYGTY